MAHSACAETKNGAEITPDAIDEGDTVVVQINAAANVSDSPDVDAHDEIPGLVVDVVDVTREFDGSMRRFDGETPSGHEVRVHADRHKVEAIRDDRGAGEHGVATIVGPFARLVDEGDQDDDAPVVNGVALTDLDAAEEALSHLTEDYNDGGLRRETSLTGRERLVVMSRAATFEHHEAIRDADALDAGEVRATASEQLMITLYDAEDTEGSR